MADDGGGPGRTAGGLGLSGDVHPNEIVLGAAIAALALLASQIPVGAKAAICTKDGKVLVEMSRMSHSEGRIQLKGKTFGTMPATT